MSDDINLLPPTERGAEKKVLDKNFTSELGAENFYAPDLLSEKPTASAQAPLVKPNSNPISEEPVIKTSPQAPASPINNNPIQIKKTFDLTQTQNQTKTENQTAPTLTGIPPQKIGSTSGFWAKFLNIFKPKTIKVSNSNGNGFHRVMDVNLIPIDLDLLPTKKLINRLWKVFFLGLAIVVIGYFGAKYYGQRLIEQEKTLTSQLSDSTVRYDKLKQEEDKWTNWRDNVEAIKLLLNRHIYWSNIFTKLEAVTLPEVYYSNISASIDGSITMSAVADSYLTVARQYLAYQKYSAEISKASISGISGPASGGSVNFTVSLTFTPESYFKQTTN